MIARSIPKHLLRRVKKQYMNKGFHTNRRIVVIESDDWGSIRMPSKGTYEELKNMGDSCEKDAFLKNDSLESKEDLLHLFDLLRQYKDKNGRHPCITANFAVANPDFDKIVPSNNFYSYEPFTTTYKKYYGNSETIMDLIYSGIGEHLFYPQLHSREHMNVKRWMCCLVSGRKDVQIAFNHHMIGIGASFSKENRFGYMDALNYDSKEELNQLSIFLEDAFGIFEKSFGYRSKTFVASCFTWTNPIERILYQLGIEMIQTQFKQNIFPLKGTRCTYNRYHYTGEENALGQLYSVRNCEYEPAYDHQFKVRAESCLREIHEAFAAQKPAIINSHRFNYISSISPQNGDIGLDGLNYILKSLVETEPNIEFMSSVELLDCMKNELIEVEE